LNKQNPSWETTTGFAVLALEKQYQYSSHHPKSDHYNFRICQRLRSFDLENPKQKIAAFGSSYSFSSGCWFGERICA